MYYGFLEDYIFTKDTVINLGDSVPKVCYNTIQSDTYFKQKVVITDPRETRPTIANNEITAKMKFTYDRVKHTSETLFDFATNENIGDIFSMIERIYLSKDETLNDIEADLITDEVFSLYYIPNTLKLSNYRTVEDLPFKPAITLNIPDYIQFAILVDNIRTEFKIWLSRDAFLKDYPFSNITKVILPCDYRYILNPSAFNSIIDAVIKSNEFSFAEIDEDSAVRAQSGLMTYKTKYVISSTNVQSLPFGILYQGTKPSTMEIRLAIREEILGLGVAPESTWRELLPDLFVTGQFYLVPIWDNTTITVNRTLYPSIININSLLSKFRELFPDTTDNFLQSYTNLLTVNQSEIFLLALPDVLNEANQLDLRIVHKTYQYHSNMESAYAYMDPVTKEFNLRLNRVMAALFGETVLDDAVETIIDELHYLSFVVDGLEYHVLSKESYEEFFK